MLRFDRKQQNSVKQLSFNKKEIKKKKKEEVGFLGGTSGKEPTCQCRRQKTCEFNPWVRKIPWRRAWQLTSVLLPGESMDRGAWWATVCGFTKSQTRLKET